MVSFARGAAVGVASTLLVIAALCVIDARMNSRFEEVAEARDLRGNDLLKAQADALNEERHLAAHGQDMTSVDDMLHGFQTPTQDSYSELTEELEKQAPKKTDLDVALSAQMPNAQGIIKVVGDEKKASRPEEELFAEEMNFVQEWTPMGQSGLAGRIDEVKASDEEESLKEDRLEGHGLLSSIGLEKDEDDDVFGTVFVQEEATWEPQGQEGLSDQLATASDEDDEAEAEEMGLKGDSLLGAVGIQSDEDYSDEELGLVQVEASEWVPQGQGGLANAIQDREEDDEAAAVKEDGLQGTSLLSAVGVHTEAAETSFVQDSVTEWKPKGQKVHVKHYHEHKEEEASEYMAARGLHADGLEGDSLLSAVGLGDHMKAEDEMSDLGTIKEDELELDLD